MTKPFYLFLYSIFNLFNIIRIITQKVEFIPIKSPWDAAYCAWLVPRGPWSENVGCDESHHFYRSYSFSRRMRNSLKIRWFAILPAWTKSITPAPPSWLNDGSSNVPIDEDTSCVSVLTDCSVCHDDKEIRPARTKPSSIAKYDSILFIIGAIHRTLPIKPIIAYSALMAHPFTG